MVQHKVELSQAGLIRLSREAVADGGRGVSYPPQLHLHHIHRAQAARKEERDCQGHFVSGRQRQPATNSAAAELLALERQAVGADEQRARKAQLFPASQPGHIAIVVIPACALKIIRDDALLAAGAGNGRASGKGETCQSGK